MSDINISSSTQVFELFQQMLPRYLADITLVKKYQYVEEVAFDFPITAFFGKKDTWISKNTIDKWNIHTLNKFQLHSRMISLI